jgi:predicted nucleotidyltransferase
MPSGTDLPDNWPNGMIGWARGTRAVSELWLFGSRAKGTARPDSDVDIAIALVPAIGSDNWALRDYLACAKEWRLKLEQIVQRHVSLTAIVPDTPGDKEVRSTGILLWKRADHPVWPR